MRKTPSILSAIFPAILLAGLAPAVAQTPEDTKAKVEKKGKEARGKQGPRNTKRFFRRFDVNKDDKVSRKEFYSVKRISKLAEKEKGRLFDRLDKDQDNFITRKEFKSMAKKGRPNPLAGADADKDGDITFEEFSKFARFAKMPEARRKKIFGRLDIDKNGKINRKDGGQFRGENGKPQRKGGWRPNFAIKPFDIDGDGALSWGEFQNLPVLLPANEKRKRNHFRFFDQNGDGHISASELSEARKKGIGKNSPGWKPKEKKEK